MQISFLSYRILLVLLLLTFSISKSVIAQIALLDDITLTDQQRDQQLLKNNFKNKTNLLVCCQIQKYLLIQI